MANKTTDKISKEEIIAYTNEYERRQAMKSCEYFIEHFVFIEDRDTVGLATPFTLWDGQKKALQSFVNERLNIVLKARQLGFTWLSLAYAIWGLIFIEGYSVVSLSKSEEDAKELVRRVKFILRYMPIWLIKEKGTQGTAPLEWDGTALQVTIYRKGEASIFKSFPAAQDSGRSFTASLVVLDEWAFQQWAREIWTAAYPTINRPTGGKLIGLSTIKRGTLFEDIWVKSVSGDNNFKRTFLSWNADPRRTKEWYEQTRKDMGEAVYSEYPCNEEEAFTVVGGRFFNEFRQDIHTIEPFNIPDDWRRYVTIDYGLDMLAAYWIAIDNHNKAYVYKEVYKSGLIISDAAKAIIKANADDNIKTYFAPPDLWNRRQETGKSAIELFYNNGISFTKSINDRVQGWYNLKEWLKPFEDEQGILTANLVIFKNCQNLIRTLPQLQFDSSDPNDVSDQPHELTHAPDAIRGFIAGRPRATAEQEIKGKKKWIEVYKKQMKRR